MSGLPARIGIVGNYVSLSSNVLLWTRVEFANSPPMIYSLG